MGQIKNEVVEIIKSLSDEEVEKLLSFLENLINKRPV